MRKIIKLSTAKNKYRIPNRNLQNAILDGRIHLINEDSINITEMESEYLKDSEAIPIERIIEDISLRESFFLSNGNLALLKKDILKYQNWGIDFRTSNVLLTERPTRDTIYIWDFKEERKVILAWILNHLDILPPSANYTKLWELIDKQTEFVLQKTLECSSKVINEKNLSFQYKFISRIIMEKKHVDKWEVADCQKFIRKYNDNKSKSYLKRLMENANNKRVNDFFKQITLGSNTDKKDEKHYTVSQYLSLGALLFHPAYFVSEGIIERAIQNSLYAQAILYMAMTIVSSWRRDDLLKIKVANEFDIEKAINRLKNGDLPYDISNPVWFGFRLFYMNYEVANKNKGNLYISSSIQLGKVAGLYLIIAEYHRIRECREELLEASKFNKKSVFKEALGERCYEEIFGKEMFCEKYMNKAFLDLYADETSEKFKVMRFKSLPVMLDAFLRGHKINLKRGQKVIFHYISFSSEGMSLDEVLLELFKVGNFGFYMNKVLTILDGDFNYHGLAENLDTRLFGGLDMASENGKKENKRSIGITLPVSFNHPRTYHPIIIRDIFLNRSYRVDSNEDGTNQGSSFANSSKIVEYGLYWMSGGINAIEAKRTNTTDEDIEKLIQALCRMFDNDYSSMRPLGSMTVRHVYVWKWDEEEKNVFANKIKDSIKVALKEDVISPSCYEDYIIKEYDCGIELRDYIN